MNDSTLLIPQAMKGGPGDRPAAASPSSSESSKALTPLELLRHYTMNGIREAIQCCRDILDIDGRFHKTVSLSLYRATQHLDSYILLTSKQKFPRLVGRYCSYLLPTQALSTFNLMST